MVSWGSSCIVSAGQKAVWQNPQRKITYSRHRILHYPFCDCALLCVMPWSKRLDLFMQDAELSQRFFKECNWLFLAVAHFVCKLEAGVCLGALNGIWKLFYHMLQELGGRIGALLLECFQVTMYIDNTFLQLPLQLGMCCEHISHQFGLFVTDTASFHKASEYIWGLAV